METKIFYTETGYNRTSYIFFEMTKETNCFYYLRAIDKHNNKFGVNPDRTKITGQQFRIKKNNLRYTEWNNQELIENRNYTYTGN